MGDVHRESRTVEHRGCRIAYDVRGVTGPRNGIEDSGRTGREPPTVLLIQGVGLHGDGWLPQTEALASKYRCVTFDNRGMGRSQPAAAPITVEQMAEDALAVLDAEKIGSAHVVGHSLGGLVAFRLALEARARVKSLALMCTFADGRAAAPLTLRMMWLGMRTRIGTRRMRRRAFLRLVMPADSLVGVDLDAMAERLAPLFGHDLGDQPPVVSAQLSAMRKYTAAPRLAELSGLPTLVLSGAHDPISPPRVSAALATGIPGARHVAFADASHGLPVQHPDRVNALLSEHFAAASG
ncbi:MAG: alpha/beta hydrolase [Planctomycetes bacterium]|nr:alpha/beta hydrolase [Planctomycetota bacterium]